MQSQHKACSGQCPCAMQIDQSKVTNVLDKWIMAATRSLIVFVREEMGAYRLYTVVPRLVKFIDDLTNIYVRYNRRRLKGRSGDADCTLGLTCLYNVLLTICQVLVFSCSCKDRADLLQA